MLGDDEVKLVCRSQVYCKTPYNAWDNPHNKGPSSPHIKMSKAQAEKPCFGDIWHHDLDLNQNIREGMESLDGEAGLN